MWQQVSPDKSAGQRQHWHLPANSGRSDLLISGFGVRVPGGAHNRRSSLKERGRSRGVGPFFSASSSWFGRAGLRRRGQGSGVARPRSGRRALMPAPFGARSGLRRRDPGVVLLVGSVGVWTSRSSWPGVPGGGRPGVWAAVIPSPRQERHDGVRSVLAGRDQSEGRPRHPRVGVLTCTIRADRFAATAAHAAVAG